MNKQKDYPFSDEDLKGFKKNIEKKLERLRNQVQDLDQRRRDVMEGNDTEKFDYEDDSIMDQEVTRLNGLIENDMNQVQALEAALLRIQNRTYGICTETGDFIRRERLEAMPEATTCMAAAE